MKSKIGGMSSLLLLLAVLMTAFELLVAFPPVIFAPGYGGSDLYGFIRYEVPNACGIMFTHSFMLTHSLTN